MFCTMHDSIGKFSTTVKSFTAASQPSSVRIVVPYTVVRGMCTLPCAVSRIAAFKGPQHGGSNTRTHENNRKGSIQRHNIIELKTQGLKSTNTEFSKYEHANKMKSQMV